MTKEMRPSNPATEKQIAFIKRLVAQGKTIDGTYNKGGRFFYPDVNRPEYLSKYEAIGVIDALLAS